MNKEFKYSLDKASVKQVSRHFLCCDDDFKPSLSGRVDIETYAKKIVNNAICFEAWSDDVLIGLVAVYCRNKQAYVTNVSVLHNWAGKGIAANLMKESVSYIKGLGGMKISLQVSVDNISALNLYKKIGFTIINISGEIIDMNLTLVEEKNEQ